MAQALFKIKDLINSEICPIGRNKLMKLIEAGERKKESLLKNNESYIIGTNVGDGKKYARWLVSREEVEAWQEREKNRIRKV